VKTRKRVGRGQGSGRGGTSTRGHKGAGARAGTKAKLGFEGGQMPLYRRVPKFGFTNISRKEFAPVNVSRLDALAQAGRIGDGVVTPAVLYDLGVISSRRALVKILGNGDLTSKLHITAHAFSKSAVAKIEAAGGQAETLSAKS
jgi:large subunit ribosomal protein L15